MPNPNEIDNQQQNVAAQNQLQTEMPQPAETAAVQQQPQTQTGGDELIDEGVAGKPNEPVSNSGNTLSQARNQFAAMFNDEPQQTGTEQNTEMPESTGTKTRLNTTLPDIGVNASQSNAPVMPDISQIVRDAVSEGISRGLFKETDMEEPPMMPEESEPEYEDEFEMPDFESDEFYEKFTENPGQTIADLMTQSADHREKQLLKRLQPVLEQSDRMMENQRMQDAIRKFAEDGGINDLGDYKDDMVAIIKDRNYPVDDVLSYELSYGKAKANKLEQLNQQLRATQGRTLADHFNDSNSVKQMAQNDAVKKAVIEEYLAGLSKGGNPRVISDGAGIAPSAIEPKKANDFKEAGKMFRKLF